LIALTEDGNEKTQLEKAMETMENSVKSTRYADNLAKTLELYNRFVIDEHNEV
jgi:hypothetical protein